ncbi:hypothetical protein CEUSTIGMA_g6064.t1 [Chlamydomonas eustigma]|uniref:Uncharacterized protein n=1 Tax=Chlamydomonas eustigma TaxID=1157962 RepID=A0A250X6D4_9CHLO|nr:hypothetical protein CEUSTIGMA_g6064.t1 [Chlamydomonas eustigma]|eukprot:GAX78625.1 hypothetical protein CEUSTIGMA_g6064.t1 [Chlamydomonas eustigma]
MQSSEQQGQGSVDDFMRLIQSQLPQNQDASKDSWSTLSRSVETLLGSQGDNGTSNDDSETPARKKQRIDDITAEAQRLLEQHMQQQLTPGNGMWPGPEGKALTEEAELQPSKPATGPVGLELLAAAADVAGGAENDYATLLAAQERGEDIGPEAAAAIAAHRQALLQQLIQQHQLLEVQQRQQDLGQGSEAATAAGEGQVPPPAPLLPDSFPAVPQPFLSVEAMDRPLTTEATGTDIGSIAAATALPAADPTTLNQEQQRELLLQQLAAVVPPGMDISYLQALLASADPNAMAQAMQAHEEGAASTEAEGSQQQQQQQADLNAAAVAAMAAAGMLPGGLQQQLMGLSFPGMGDLSVAGGTTGSNQDSDTEDGGEEANADLAPILLAHLQSTLGVAEGTEAAEAILPQNRKKMLATLLQQQLHQVGGSGGLLLPQGAGGEVPSSLPVSNRAGRQGNSRRFYEPTQKVQFEGEGMKLADGRIYVPLPFIHKNFPHESEWPVQLPADIFVNEDCIKEAYPVKIARSQNKTRRHGLGNHWVTGHQKLIKNYKDVRLQGLEICTVSGHLKVMLSASGSWDDVQTQVAQTGAAGSLPGSTMQSTMMMSPYGSPAMAVAQLLFAQQQQNQLLAQPDLAALLGMPGGSAAGAAGFPGFMDSNVLAAFAAAAAATEDGQTHGLLEQQQQQGEAEGTIAANAEVVEGEKQEPATASTHPAVPDDAAVEASANTSEPPAAGSSGQATTAGSSADGQTMDIAAALAAMNAMQQQQHNQALAAEAGREQASGADAEPPEGNATDVEAAAAAAAESQAAMDAAAAAGLQHLLQASGALNFNLPGGNEAMAMLQAAGASGSSGGGTGSQAGNLLGVGDPNAMAGLDLMSMLQRMTSGNPSDMLSTLFATLGGGGGQMAVPYPPRSQQSASASSLPRLYDGRIHVPLSLVQDHFKDAEFPLPIFTTIFVNGLCIGEGIQARIVKYKKHKRPNHFNFWITGLQKTLGQYNDVRQAGVMWEADNVLRVNLMAAN